MRRSIIKVIQSHTGSILIGGAICLKAGAMMSSWPLLIGGYGSFAFACFANIKKWRDRDDHQN